MALLFLLSVAVLSVCAALLRQRAVAEPSGGVVGMPTRDAVKEAQLHEPIPADRDPSAQANAHVLVLLADGRTPAAGASVFQAEGPEGAAPPAVEEQGVLLGVTGDSGMLLVDAPAAGRWLAARSGHRYVQCFVPQEVSLAELVLPDDYSPVLRVVDLDGSRVAGARLEILDGEHEVLLARRTDDAGEVRARNLRASRHPEGLRARVAMPGRTVLVPLDPNTPQSPILVAVGAVGTMQIEVRGSAVGVDVVVVESRASVDHGVTELLRAVDRTAKVVVAAEAVTYSVRGARSDGRQVALEVRGPEAPGLTVAAVLDFSGCRVSGRAAAFAGREDIDVFLLGGRLAPPLRTRGNERGAFEVVVPRDGSRATIVFVVGDECAVREQVPIDRDVVHLDELSVEPRPVLGMLVVHDDHGSLVLDPPQPLSAVLDDGRSVPLQVHRWLRTRALPERGVEVLGLPGLRSAVVAAVRRGHFAQPGEVELSGGVTRSVRLAVGGTVRLLVANERGDGFRTLWLRNLATGATHASTSARKAVGGQHNEFVGLAPGTYVVEGAAVQITAPRIEVSMRSDQEVAVTLR